MKTFLPINIQPFIKMICMFILHLLLFVIPIQTVFSQTRTFVNPGLEFGVPNGTSRQIDTNFGYTPNVDAGSAVSNPWYTTHPVQAGVCFAGGSGNCHPMEVWATGFQGVPSAQGTNFIELNAYVNSMIYQNLYLRTGDVITYYFRHRARSLTQERTAMVIDNQSGTRLATVHQTNIPASTGAWSINQGTYTYTGPSGIQRVGFVALANGGNGGLGNFLDDVRITLSPIVDTKGSVALSSCEGTSNGTLALRINGAVPAGTRVAVELVDPVNGNPVATDADITLTPVTNSLGTPLITHTPGTSIYLVTIPPGNYDGGVIPGYTALTNNEDGITINITSINEGIDEPLESYEFEIKPENTNGSTNNFESGETPVFGDQYYERTNDFFIERCICFDNPNTSSVGTDTNIGITLLGRAGTNNSDNWPMLRKGGHVVLESNTKGLVITRLTTLQINALVSPQEGMMVYDTTAKCLKLYDGTSWNCYVIATCP